MSDSKKALREKIWSTMTAKRVARYPGAHGRIPNFVGTQTAARHLAALQVWQQARTIKCNPDSPQRDIRYMGLKAGKVTYMAVPRLRDRKPFIELDPTRLQREALWEASSIRGAFALGRPVTLGEMSTIDLIVAGSVAVSRDGARLGKGGGYSDLEYALTREAQLIGETTPIVTTVHHLQVVPDGEIEMTAHDIAVTWFATPEEIVQTKCRYRQPLGILWTDLGEKLGEIPVLQDFVERHR